MKTNILKLLLVAIVLLVVNASAYATTYTQTDVFTASATHASLNNVNVLYYQCPNNDPDCNTVTTKLVDTNSGSASSYTFGVATDPSVKHYFAKYLTKSCYIPKQYKEWAYGNAQMTWDIAFDKVNSCKAEVQNVYVTGELETGKLIQINVDTGLGATTYSAFKMTGVGPKYLPPQLKDEFYSAQTTITVKIVSKATGQVVQTLEPKTANIFADESADLMWTWRTPTQAGSYDIVVESEVTDCQCASNVKDSAIKNIVIEDPEEPVVCYTVVNNLNALPVLPRAGDAVDISARINGAHTQNSALKINVKATATKKDASSPEWQMTHAVNQNTWTTEHFQWVPASSGSYTIKVEAYINDPKCDKDNMEFGILPDFTVRPAHPADRPPTMPKVVLTPSPNANDSNNLLCQASGSTDPDSLTCKCPDTDQNGIVNIGDLTPLGMYYGKSSPARVDLNSDGIINEWDEDCIAEFFGKSTSDPALQNVCTNGGSTPGAVVTYEYRWKVANVQQSAYDNKQNVPASATTVGQRWKCEARAKSGSLYSGWNFVDTLINADPQNDRRPTDPEVVLTPSPNAYDSQELSCIGNNSIDPDGTTVSYEYRWYSRVGASGPLTEHPQYINIRHIPASATTVGEQWVCSVRSFSHNLYSLNSVPAGTMIIQDINQPPSNPTVTLVPSPTALDAQNLKCTASGSVDAEHDAITYEYRWYRNDVRKYNYDNKQDIPNSETAIGDVWKCEARALAGGATNPAGWIARETHIIRGGANAAPILNPIGNKTIVVGQTLTVTISGSDPDGDAISFFADNVPYLAHFDQATKTFTWTPTAEQAGAYYDVTFRVTDAFGMWDSEVVRITVTTNGVNHAPILNPIGNREVVVNTQIAFTISATDQDNDPLTYSTSALPAGASFNAATRTFTWTPAAIGNYDITFSVSDGHGGSDSEVVRITVTNVPHQKPVTDTVSVTPSPTASDNENLVCTVVGHNPDGTAVTARYVWTKNGNDAVMVSTQKTIPANQTSVNDVWTCWGDVVDNENGDPSDYKSARTTIVAAHVNHAPTLDPIGNKDAFENVLLQFGVSGTDPDHDVLMFNASGLPAGASFNAATRIFTWIPNSNQGSIFGTTYHVTFSVNDGHLTDSETITIRVYDFGGYQVMVAVNPAQAQDDEDIDCFVKNPSPFFGYLFSWKESPGTVIGSGRLNYGNNYRTTLSHELTAVGHNYTCTVDAFFGTLPISRGSATATVIRPNPNNGPVFTTFPKNRYLCDNDNHPIDQFTYTAHAVDPDGDAVTYSLTLGPSGMTIDATTGMVGWPISSVPTSFVNVIITATDVHGLSATQSFSLTGCDTENEQTDPDEIMHFTMLSIPNDFEVRPGDTVEVYFNLENRGSIDLKHVTVTATVLDFDARYSIGPKRLDNDDSMSGTLYLEIPKDVTPGLYTVRIEASDNDLRRIIHRDIMVVK